MVLSSIFFIFAFLPIVLGIYYFAPKSWRNPILLAANLFFYAWGDPIYIVLMLFSTVFNYYMALQIDKIGTQKSEKKHDLIFTIIVNLFILCFFKYYGGVLEVVNKVFGANIAIRELGLPIGISFYTFKNLSYIIDVYKGKTVAQRSFLKFSVYATMFACMTAGPIVRYEHVEEQLSVRKINPLVFGRGVEMFFLGLAKKVLLADTLAAVYAEICANGEMSVLTAWIGIFAYTMQIYFDFSGYSDMALGVGRMLGFEFEKNFDYPYVSKSITEFWRRWHISLGTWFKDYIYIPLGGNRVSAGKRVRNILVVWCLTGMWHGASLNFAAWGLYYGVVLLLEKNVLDKVLKRMPSWAAHLYTMLLVMIGWLLFSQTDFKAGMGYLGAMFGVGAKGFIDRTALYYLKTCFITFVICIMASGKWLLRKFNNVKNNSVLAAVVIYVILFVLSTAFMVYNSYQPFLYLRF